jgi:hypothetical protein
MYLFALPIWVRRRRPSRQNAVRRRGAIHRARAVGAPRRWPRGRAFGQRWSDPKTRAR